VLQAFHKLHDTQSSKHSTTNKCTAVDRSDTDMTCRRQLDPKAAVVSRRKPPGNVLSHKPPQNF